MWGRFFLYYERQYGQCTTRQKCVYTQKKLIEIIKILALFVYMHFF